MTRRQFFNRSIVGLVGLGVTGFGSAVLAFLWPGVGSKIVAGDLEHILATISDTHWPYYVRSGPFYVVPHPDQGVLALYEKCTHLGCRVSFCPTSEWFECACHAAMFNFVGEQKHGPAPRGLDRFPVEVVNGQVVVDTSAVLTGPPAGTDTTGQEPAGPHCV